MYLEAVQKTEREALDVPFMGTQLTDNAGEALFGKVRRKLLSLFLLNSEESYSFRETARLINAGHGAVHRELANLVNAGIIICEKVGNQTRYQADPSCNVFEELQGLLIKTTGIGESIRQSIQGLKKSISIAFIFGSYASSSVQTGSDVDLMVIGQISFQEIVSSIHNLQRKFGREINPTVYSPESLRGRADSGFIRGVMAGKKIFLIGNEDELDKMV